MSTAAPSLVVTPGPLAANTRERKQAPWWRLLMKNPVGMVGAVIMIITIVVALFAPLIAPFDPSNQDADRLLGPSATHLLGTDELGRDTFSRVVYGARVSLSVAIVAILVSLVFGGLLGILSGYFGGALDSFIMRVVDILFAFPGLILAIVIAGLLGPSTRNAMIAIGVIYAPAFARVIRSSILGVLNELYIESAQVAGANSLLLVFRHILPNILAPMIVLVTVYLSSAILSEASLSFLGLGTQPPEPSWGGMLNASRTYMELNPWMAIAPGLAIMIVVLGLNFLGDGLRDVLDPRLRIR
jgi:peptide/nickel transport system permease protein